MEFNQQWTSKKRTIMEFNQFLDSVYENSFKDKIFYLIDEYLKQIWK